MLQMVEIVARLERLELELAIRRGCTVVCPKEDTDVGKIPIVNDDGLLELSTNEPNVFSSTILGLSNLNTITTPGYYNQVLNSNTPGNNYPEDLAGALLVLKSTVTGVVQVFYRYTDGVAHTRGLYNSTWSAWTET